MKMQNPFSVVAVLLILASAASAQESAFKAGQALYVVAVRSSRQPDPSTERKIKVEFEKQKSFKIAISLQSADFVFLMVVEYEFNQVMFNNIGAGVEEMKSVEAFVVRPDAYTQHKADLDNLRDKALWRIRENNNARRTNDLPKKVVQKFHEGTAPRNSSRGAMMNRSRTAMMKARRPDLLFPADRAHKQQSRALRCSMAPGFPIASFPRPVGGLFN